MATNSSQQQQGETEVMVDEIQYYFRYVSSIGGTCRIFGFKMHDRSHSVMVLPVHLHKERIILYEELDDHENIQRRLESRSKFEAFLKLNRENEEARQYLYAEIPEHYTWDNKNAERTKRK